MLPDFGELGAGGGFAIPLTEERGITLPQLGAMLAFFEEHICGGEQGVLSRKGEKLEYNTVNLYDIVEHIVKPATQKKKCSYVEFVASGPQLPKWFVSHFWGQKTLEFVRCLLQHSNDRALGDDAAYWICAFAAIQWAANDAPDWIAPDWVNMYASNQWCDPEASPFQRAMRLAEGTVSIIDSYASYFERVWCCYEIWSTLRLAAAAANLQSESPADGEKDGYKLDIYTCVSEDHAVGLTDGLAQVDKKRAKHWWTTNKYHREKDFPIELARSALSLKLELGQASQEADRIHILNSIVGASDLDAPPPKQHVRYNQLNNTLRGRFAAALWRRGLEGGQLMQEYGHALASSGLVNLAISFDSCDKFDDLAARALAAGLAPSIRELDLDFNGCGRLSDDGVEALAVALPPCMRQLKLDLSGCKFSDCALKALAHSLSKKGLAVESTAAGSEDAWSLVEDAWELVPLLRTHSADKTYEPNYEIARSESGTMEELSLIFASCGHLAEDGMIAVIQALPQTLKKLVLNFYGCVVFGDSLLEALSAALPSTLLYFELRVARCPDVTDSGVQAVVKMLPQGLQHLVLDFRFCINLSDSTATVLAESLPLFLKHLETDFVSCSGTTGITEEVLQKVVAKRGGMKFIFWGKDDFAVNM